MFTEKNLFFLHCSFHLNCHLPLLLLCFSLLIFLKYLLVIGCAFPLKHEGNWNPHFWVFIYFIFVLLYNIVLVLPYINMNPPRVYTCSQSWTPLLPPSPLPSLWVIPVHQPQVSCIMHWTWTGDLFLIWYYTCFNAILPNLPTLSLSNRVQKADLYICVSFAVSHTGLSLPSF